MQVVCESIDDFVENLRNAKGVFENTVRVSITRPEEHLREHAKTPVIFRASTLVVNPDTQECFLLNISKESGIDYMDGSGESEGSDRANEWKQKVKETAEEIDCVLLPGWIEL